MRQKKPNQENVCNAEPKPVSEWTPSVSEEDGEIRMCANLLSHMFRSYLTKVPHLSLFCLFQGFAGDRLS